MTTKDPVVIRYDLVRGVDGAHIETISINVYPSKTANLDISNRIRKYVGRKGPVLIQATAMHLPTIQDHAYRLKEVDLNPDRPLTELLEENGWDEMTLTDVVAAIKYDAYIQNTIGVCDSQCSG